MDQCKKTKGSSKSVSALLEASASNQDLRQWPDLVEAKDPIAARKVQKADREKLRRDRLNEQFLELGNTLDPDRPKNDKATILTDTVQMLNDLTAEVNRLKAEYTALSEESRELIQEKNELREEKSSLKSDIENLNAQYQHRLRTMVPWAPVDPSSIVMGPHPYSYPIPVGISSAPIPIHPQLQPFPFFGSQNPGAISNPCSTFIPFSASASPPIEQASVRHASSSNVSSKQDSKTKSLNHRKNNHMEKCDDHDHNDVATDLELKTPGSSAQQEISTEERKGKPTQKKERSVATVGSSPSRYSSSHGVQDSSCNSMDDVSKSTK